MTHQIVRSVVFTICEGRVLNEDKNAVAKFLGGSHQEQELSRLGYENERGVLAFIRSITPEKQLINLYRGPSGYGGGCEECVLAQIESTI
jgi:hypothetical protein